jgi:hypothetical protein
VLLEEAPIDGNSKPRYLLKFAAAIYTTTQTLVRPAIPLVNLLEPRLQLGFLQNNPNLPYKYLKLPEFCNIQKPGTVCTVCSMTA